MTPNFDDLFEAVAKEFETAFVRSSQGIRPDEKGGPREEQLRQFLRDWLPSQYGVTNGYIINTGRKTSRECDVIFYDSLLCPKFILDKTTDRRLVPFGNAYGMIEVKSTLGKAELEDALEKIEALDNLYYSDLPVYTPNQEYDEYKIRAVETDNPSDSPFSRPTRKEPILDKDWRHFRVEIERSSLRTTPPFSIVFAYKLASNLTLEAMESLLKDYRYVPDAIVVLDSGLLMHFSEEAMRRYKSIKEGRPIENYRYDPEVIFTLIDRAGDPSASRYIIEKPENQRASLLFFYAFLLDLLEKQRLADHIHTDLVAIWRKNE
jgi:hypothetical protein